MLRFRDLSEIVFGKNYNIFLFRSVESGVTDVEHIGTQRQVRSMLLKNSEWEQTCPLRAVNTFEEVGGCEFFPVHG